MSLNLASFRFENTGKTVKDMMILKFFAIVAKRKFDTEPYDCFAE